MTMALIRLGVTDTVDSRQWVEEVGIAVVLVRLGTTVNERLSRRNDTRVGVVLMRRGVTVTVESLKGLEGIGTVGVGVAVVKGPGCKVEVARVGVALALKKRPTRGVLLGTGVDVCPGNGVGLAIGLGVGLRLLGGKTDGGLGKGLGALWLGRGLTPLLSENRRIVGLDGRVGLLSSGKGMGLLGMDVGLGIGLGLLLLGGIGLGLLLLGGGREGA
eukprot:EG_transcript_21769